MSRVVGHSLTLATGFWNIARLAAMHDPSALRAKLTGKQSLGAFMSSWPERLAARIKNKLAIDLPALRDDKVFQGDNAGRLLLTYRGS